MSEEATLDDFAQQEESDEQRQNWRKVKLHEVAYKRSDNVDPQEVELEKHVGLEHIDPNNPVPDWESLDDLSSTKRRFEAGDILFAKLRPNLEKSAQPDFEGVASTDIFPIVAESDMNSKWLLYRLSSKPAYDYARRTSAGTRMPRTSWNLFSNFSFDLPPLPEQRKIATVLYTVDRAIENAEEIETQLQRVKKGATQKLFTFGLNNEDTQSHHIGDFPQSWEFEKVSNLAAIERGNTPRTSHDEYYGGEIAWVTPDDLSDMNEEGNGKYISDSGRKLTPEGVESSSLTVVEPDSVMFTSRSYGIGRTAICIVPAATNQGITAFECGESLDTEFFYYYLNYIMDYVVSISGGSTFPEISKSATGNIDVPVPGIEEQKEIVSLLSQFDEQILHNREVTSQLKRIKHGLMQDLLSGTVQTTNANIEVPDEIEQHG